MKYCGTSPETLNHARSLLQDECPRELFLCQVYQERILKCTVPENLHTCYALIVWQVLVLIGGLLGTASACASVLGMQRGTSDEVLLQELGLFADVLK